MSTPQPRRSLIHRLERWRLRRRIGEIRRAMDHSHEAAARHTMHAAMLSSMLARAWADLNDLDALS